MLLNIFYAKEPLLVICIDNVFQKVCFYCAYVFCFFLKPQISLESLFPTPTKKEETQRKKNFLQSSTGLFFFKEFVCLFSCIAVVFFEMSMHFISQYTLQYLYLGERRAFKRSLKQTARHQAEERVCFEDMS